MAFGRSPEPDGSAQCPFAATHQTSTYPAGCVPAFAARVMLTNFACS
jgi:hypothetical protein